MRAQVALTVVAVILGLLVVVQIRAQGAGSQLAGRSAQELTLLVANLNDRNAQLRTEVSLLEAEARELQATKARGESSLDDLGRDLSRIRRWAGLDAVAGSGVQVRVAGVIGGEGVMELVNELRNGGAEAIAIDGTRVVAGTVVAGPPGGLSVEDRAVPDPFVIEAIGSPETLTGTLKRVGGVAALLAARYPDLTLTVTPARRVVLEPTERDLAPANGTPRL
jgi:uncharacterized protein YlxW (UPF0749 family)